MSNPFAGAAAAPATAPAAAQGNPFGAQQAAPAAQQAPPAADAFAAPPSTTPEPAAPAAGGDPFGMPSGGGDGPKITDDLGAALLLRPTEFRPQMNTSNGPADVIVADWIVLDGPSQGQVREGSLIFQRVLVKDLKKIFDNPATPFMVGVLGKGEARNGNSAPYLFGMPSDEQVTLARQAAAHFGWI